MRNVIFWPFRGLYKIYYFALFVVSLVIMYPLFYVSLLRESWFPITFQLKRFWSLILQLGGGIVVWRTNKRAIPKKGPYIICSNHSSYLDIILMYRVFPDYFVMMGKHEIKNWPLFRIFFTRNMNILVDRESRRGAHQAFVRAGEEIDKGNSIMVFPEGGIPDSAPIMRVFKNGAFKLAIDKQIPIVPVTFITNCKILEGSILLKGKAGPDVSRVVIHDVVETAGMTEKDLVNLKQRVFDTIKAPLEKYHGS